MVRLSASAIAAGAAPGITSVATAPHYTWGASCDGWHLVRTGDLSVIQERMPPGTTEARHLHRRAHQFFLVLHGRLAIECSGVTCELGPLQGLAVPAGKPHRVHNASAEAAEFLVVSQPPSQGDRVAAP